MRIFRLRPLSKAFLLAILLLLAGSAFNVSHAQGTKKQQNRRKELEKEIALLEKQIKDNQKKSASALNTLNLIDAQISSRKALVAESDREISSIEKDIAACQGHLDTLQARLDTLSTYYNRLVRSAYKNRDTKVWYMYLLSSANIGQAVRRAGYLKGLSTRMNAQARKIMHTRDEVQVQKQELDSLHNEATGLRDRRRSEMASLQKEEASAKALVGTLKKNKKKIQQDLVKRKKQIAALDREIESAISASQNKGSGSGSKKGGTASSSKTRTEVNPELTSKFTSNKGKLPWPVAGAIVERFGQKSRSGLEGYSVPASKGMTIAVDPGTKVKAIFDGEVTRVSVQAGYNICVIIQHGSYYSFYCKLGRVSVKAGDKVKTGQSIGTVDTIDEQTNLHLRIYNGTTAVNPEVWLQK